MNLSDELKKMRNKGRQVVSIDYVLDNLRKSQSHECEHCVKIPVYTMDNFPRATQSVKGGS